MATTQVIRSERFPDLLDEVLFPRISDGKLAWLADRGEHLSFQPGEVLYEHATRDAPFYVIDRGLVEFVDRKPGQDVYVAQADSRTFIGDIALGYETCLREAEAAGIALADHAAHLVVHGVLHLLGHDHTVEDAAEAMEEIETKVLASMGVANPYTS